VAGAAEERFSRKKHTGDFPTRAIQYCLNTARITAGELEESARGFDYTPYRAAFLLDSTSAEQYDQVFSRDKLLAEVRQHLPGFPADRVHQVNHHLAHAASAFYTSGWDECLVVVIDGMGEAHRATVYHARDGRLATLPRVSAHE